MQLVFFLVLLKLAHKFIFQFKPLKFCKLQAQDRLVEFKPVSQPRPTIL